MNLIVKEAVQINILLNLEYWPFWIMDTQVNATIVIKVLMIMYLFHDEGDFSVAKYTVFIKFAERTHAEYSWFYNLRRWHTKLYQSLRDFA